MTNLDISQLIDEQRAYFRAGKTRDIQQRRQNLEMLRTLLQQNESRLNEAIYKDFGKSPYEMFITELGLIYNEISLHIRQLRKWSRTRVKGVNLVNQPALSRIIPEPYGNTLVVGAWNYPVQLSILPAVSAIAAGNTVIIKPGEQAAHVMKLLEELVNTNFPAGLMAVVAGGIPETTSLLEQKFDKIFFTGSHDVGKIVMKAAAEHLTPLTLELGGKSPAFVLKDAALERTVQRIVWGKFLNAGQTCVAPDYILVHKSLEQDFLRLLKEQIEKSFPEDLQNYEGYTRIINEKHFDRINSLIDSSKVICGGGSDREQRFIRPTVMAACTFDDPVMQDEIFGPVLPVIAYDDLDELISYLAPKARPLALYVFGKEGRKRDKILNTLSYGGGMVNEVVLHFGNDRMAFGGVGESGMGSYHGKAGFDAFTHYKSIIYKPLWFEPFIKYTPYTRLKFRLMRWILG